MTDQSILYKQPTLEKVAVIRQTAYRTFGYFPATADGAGFAAERTLQYRNGCVTNVRGEAVAFIKHVDAELNLRPEGHSLRLAEGVDLVPVIALLNEYESVIDGKLKNRM